jgi:DNA polymerase
MLDRALAEAGIDRNSVFVSNAVKHFKFEQRGKRRLHAKPSIAEIKACNVWLLEELRLLQPRLVIALGASAARGLLGRTVTISALRGRAIPLAQGAHAWVTIHPSFLLRIEDEAVRHAEYGRFVHELAQARSWVEGASRR